jgi:hypothetical protein
MEIGRRVIEMLQRELTEFDPTHPRRAIRAAYASMTTAFLSEPELTRIFLRHRTDDGTVLGRTFRQLLDQARAEMLESLHRYGVVLPRDTAEAHIELLIAGVLGLLEALLSDRLKDQDAAIDAIAGVTTSMFRALMKERKEKK